MVPHLGKSLVVTAITKDLSWIHQLFACPTIDRAQHRQRADQSPQMGSAARGKSLRVSLRENVPSRSKKLRELLRRWFGESDGLGG